jgi:hypothetical protein
MLFTFIHYIILYKRLMMNGELGKGVEGSNCGLFLSMITGFFLKGLRKTMKTPVKVACLPP